ncbi:hypothetical protein D3C76_1447970 [compost metagenome]
MTITENQTVDIGLQNNMYQLINGTHSQHGCPPEYKQMGMKPAFGSSEFITKPTCQREQREGVIHYKSKDARDDKKKRQPGHGFRLLTLFQFSLWLCHRLDLQPCRCNRDCSTLQSGMQVHGHCESVRLPQVCNAPERQVFASWAVAVPIRDCPI